MARRKKKKDWVENMISYYDSGNPGTCPFCGSSALEVFVLRIGRGSLNFHCPSCNHFGHIDGYKYNEK